MKRLILFLMLLPIALFAQDFELVSESFITGQYFDLEVVGNYVYITSWVGVEIIDISDESNPPWQNRIKMKNALYIDRMDNYLIVSSGNESTDPLYIVDVANPGEPLLVAELEDIGGYDLGVNGNLAYISRGHDGLFVYNFSNPQQPELVNQLPGGSNDYRSLMIEGNYLYALAFAGSNNFFYIYDISTPNQIQLVSETPYPGEDFREMTYCDPYIIVEGWYNLAIVDITNPQVPMFEEIISSPYLFGSFYLDNQISYLTSYEAGLRVYDFSNPLEPQLIHQIPDYTNRVLSLNDQTAYTFTETEFIINDFSDIPNITEIGSYEYFSPYVWRVSVKDDYARISFSDYWEYHIGTFEVTQVAEPALIDFVPTYDERTKIAYYDQYAYVVGTYNASHRMEIYDISNPDSMAYVLTYEFSQPRGDIIIENDLMFLANNRPGNGMDKKLEIYRLTDPLQPTQLIHIIFNEHVLDMALEGDLLYVLNNEGLIIYDVSNPESPLFLSRQYVSSRRLFSVNQDKVHVSMYNEMVAVVDVSNPTSPTIENYFSTAPRQLSQMEWVGDYLCAIDAGVGIVLYEPQTMTEVAAYETMGNPQHFTIDGQMVYIADYYDLTILELPDFVGIEDDDEIKPMNFILLQNYPNPFNPTTVISFELPAASKINLSVYNSAGQLVKKLAAGGWQPGTHEVVWDGKNEAGQTVGSGIYFYRLKTDNGDDDVKSMILLK